MDPVAMVADGAVQDPGEEERGPELDSHVSAILPTAQGPPHDYCLKFNPENLGFRPQVLSNLNQ